MNMVYLLIPLGIALLICAGAALIWAVNSGQFEDLEDAGRAALEDDEPCAAPPAETGRDNRAEDA